MANSMDLGKQVGPLPMGAWIALVGGGLGIALYMRNRTGDSGVVYANDTSSVPGVGVGGIGAYTSTDGGAPTTEGDNVQSNTQWSQRAFTFLVATGADASLVDKTLRDYLQGLPLGTQGNALISLALAKLGQPPESLPDAPALPTTPTTPPKPSGVTRQPRIHVVQPNESLYKLAAQYYGMGALWPIIWNANRALIGNNPQKLHHGYRLVIPRI